MCRGAELNCLRRPFQGRALPVSYLGTQYEDSRMKLENGKRKSEKRQQRRKFKKQIPRRSAKDAMLIASPAFLARDDTGKVIAGD